MGRKFGRGAGSPSNIVASAEAYLRAKWHLDPSIRLATINIGRKFGGAPPLFLGSAEAYVRAKFHLDPSNRLATVHERYRQTDRQDNGPVA